MMAHLRTPSEFDGPKAHSQDQPGLESKCLFHQIVASMGDTKRRMCATYKQLLRILLLLEDSSQCQTGRKLLWVAHIQLSC